MTDEEKGLVFYNVLVGFLCDNKLNIINTEADNSIKFKGISQKDAEIRIGLNYINMKELKPLAINYGNKIEDRLDSVILDIATKAKIVADTTLYKSYYETIVHEVKLYEDGTMHCDCRLFARNNTCHHTICRKYLIKDIKPTLLFARVTEPVYVTSINAILYRSFPVNFPNDFLDDESKRLMAHMICLGYSTGDIKRKFNISKTNTDLIKNLISTLEIVYKELKEQIGEK